MVGGPARCFNCRSLGGWFGQCGAVTSKKVPATRVKPLRRRAFAGMLPRTMSQGNDAFTPKDAATDAPSEDAAKSEEKAAEVAARRPASKSSRRSSRDDDDDERLVPPQTEDEIDVPKKHTIYMLGAMSTLTIVLWFMAKLTCNVHPDQVREPKHFSTRDLAADPKNAAFEFHHKFETGDFTTALDVSTGEMQRIVEGKLKECEQNADDCAKNQKELEGTIESTGKLLDRSDTRASVELISNYKKTATKKTFGFDVVKEGEFWRVASRRELPNAPVQQVPPPTATAAAPAAVAPAAPAASAPVEMSDQSSSPAQ